MTKYKLYLYIQTSDKSNFWNFLKLKNLEKWLSLNAHQPFFPGKFPTRPKIQNFFRTRVHTITLNTVTKYKLYPYIQISLNQIFEILSLCKNDKIGGKMTKSPLLKTLFAHKIRPNWRNRKIFSLDVLKLQQECWYQIYNSYHTCKICRFTFMLNMPIFRSLFAQEIYPNGRNRKLFLPKHFSSDQ